MTRLRDTAHAYIGTREYPGARSNPIIFAFWKLARLSGVQNDNAPCLVPGICL